MKGRKVLSPTMILDAVRVAAVESSSTATRISWLQSCQIEEPRFRIFHPLKNMPGSSKNGGRRQQNGTTAAAAARRRHRFHRLEPQGGVFFHLPVQEEEKG